MASTGQTETQTELFTAIREELVKVGESKQGINSRSSALRDLAIAYRALAGGQQPGSVVVEKS